MLVKQTGDGDFKIAPNGTHLGRCYLIADLGRQRGEWQGAELIREKLVMGFELYHELTDDGRPLIVYSARLTRSLHEHAALRQILETWRGRAFTDDELLGFDLNNVLGIPAMITITHATSPKSGKKYAKIAAVTAVPKGMQIPSPVNESLIYEVGMPDSVFHRLPEWIQKVIGERVENAPVPVRGSAAIDDDDVPF